MEADSENLEVPYWRTLFEAAVLELDGNKQLEFIADSEHAIMDRMVHLNRSNDGSEIQMLENALTVLGQLRKIANETAKGARSWRGALARRLITWCLDAGHKKLELRVIFTKKSSNAK